MKRKTVLKLMWPPVLWGVLVVCGMLGAFFILKEWHDYPLRSQLMSTEDCRLDELHYTLLYAFGFFSFGFLGVSVRSFYVSLMRSLRLLEMEEEEADASVDVSDETLFSALADLRIDVSGCKMLYKGKTLNLRPRVATFLDALVRKENHVLALDDLNGVFYPQYYDGSECSLSRIRGLKCETNKALKDTTPLDVAWDARKLRLRLKE